jgi:rifampicin phosphotransferase
MKRTNDAYVKWGKRFLEEMKSFDNADLSLYSYEELFQTFQQMEQLYLKHYRLIRYGMVSHSIATNLMVKNWLENWLDDSNGVLYSKLISGIPGNKTVETNIAIAKLALHAQKNTEIKKSLQQDTADLFLQKLKQNTTWESFKIHFDQFMLGYGHRCHTREVYYPCWIENPELVITLLQGLISDENLDFSFVEKQRIKERKQTEQEIFDRIGKLPFGVIKKRIFKKVLQYAQTYLTFRENQRFFLDHQHYRQRRLFLEYGRRFHKNDLIDDPMDIFFLPKEHIFDIAIGKKTLDKKRLLQEKESFFKNQGKLPPKFIKGNTEFDDTIIYDEHSVQITGVGCSPGITTGKVRIVTSISEIGSIQKNDILVTRNTDPAWTPVFKKLSGLITETGGILSHGAVVSREYNIPAITAVKQATTLLKNGQQITLDGNTGIIYIKKKE